MDSSPRHNRWLMFVATSAAALAVFFVVEVNVSDNFNFSYQYELNDLAEGLKDLPDRVTCSAATKSMPIN